MNGTQPSGIFLPGMVYDTVTQKMILFGGMNSSRTIAYNETWAYDVPARTWTRKALTSTIVPPAQAGTNNGLPTLSYNSRTNNVVLHQTSNAGAPADWQYDPVADTWQTVATGSGPAGNSVMAYDSANNVLVTFSYGGPGIPEVWQGFVLSALNRCDLNGDGKVTNVDVQAATSQALGTSSAPLPTLLETADAMPSTSSV